MNSHYKSWLSLHVAILLFGASGVLAQAVEASASFTVFSRVLFAGVALYVWLIWQNNKLLRPSTRDTLMFGLMGALLSFHWFAFFYSIKLSSVAIGVLTFATFPIATCILEPLIYRQRFAKQNLIFLLMTVIGIYCILPSTELTENDHIVRGVFWGVLSGLSYAGILLLNKSYVQRYAPITLTLYQFGAAVLVLLPIIVWQQETIQVSDWYLLAVQGVLSTALAFSLYVYASRYLSASLISIFAMLELVYGIVLAWLLLGEPVSISTTVGAAIIMAAAYLASRMRPAAAL